MCVGEFFVKTLQIWNQKIAANSIAGSNTDLSTGLGGGFDDLGFSAFDQVNGGFDMSKQNFTFRGQLHLFCASYKKSLIHFLFQCFDRLADC